MVADSRGIWQPGWVSARQDCFRTRVWRSRSTTLGRNPTLAVSHQAAGDAADLLGPCRLAASVARATPMQRQQKADGSRLQSAAVTCCLDLPRVAPVTPSFARQSHGAQRAAASSRKQCELHGFDLHRPFRYRWQRPRMSPDDCRVSCLASDAVGAQVPCLLDPFRNVCTRKSVNTRTLADGYLLFG